jgi:hypothetical protein
LEFGKVEEADEVDIDRGIEEIEDVEGFEEANALCGLGATE